MALACGMAVPAQAANGCAQSALHDHPPAVNFRIDNDLFGGTQQDQGYTNGAMLTLVSPNLADYTADPCLPAPARWINRHLERLQPGGFEQQNMIFSLAQGLFTPTDSTRTDLIAGDRPYAGVLLATFGYNARNGARLRTTQLSLGMVGPSAQGKQVQDAVHNLLGDEKFMGWDNQLHDEPVFRLLHERMRRWPADGNAGSWGWDAIGHGGGALGNLTTYANGGAEVRFGWKLPDDFGSSPMRPAGENTRPHPRRPRAGLVVAPVRRHRRALGAARHHAGRQHLPPQPPRGQAPRRRRPRLWRGGDARQVEVRAGPLPPHPRIRRAEGVAGVRQLHHQPDAVRATAMSQNCDYRLCGLATIVSCSISTQRCALSRPRPALPAAVTGGAGRGPVTARASMRERGCRHYLK